jgi:hypothetical protein
MEIFAVPDGNMSVPNGNIGLPKRVGHGPTGTSAWFSLSPRPNNPDTPEPKSTKIVQEITKGKIIHMAPYLITRLMRIVIF